MVVHKQTRTKYSDIHLALLWFLWTMHYHGNHFDRKYGQQFSKIFIILNI